jgi:arylsulfatase A-like enzyme/Tfp pilus assembly protein PilF
MMRAFGPLLVAIGFVGCASREERTPALANVILVTVDTLRADRLGAYGNESGLTPNLDRLARSGVLFENAGASAPLTLPAHVSILTGTYPLRHGIRDNGGYHLGAESVTLAESLSARGYRTGAFVGAFVLDSRWGLDQGFERYFDDFDFASFEDQSLGSVSRRGDAVLEEALRWMGGVKPGPFFAWLHFYDPHAPYEPPEPHRGRAGSRDGLYDGEVAYVDELIGRLLEWLSRESLEGSTLVAVIADHGEALEDHGELDHGFFVYDSTMKVPFILKAPGLPAGIRVEAQVRAIDLAPTVLDLVGLPPEPSAQGVSLAPLARGALGKSPALELLSYGESWYPRNHYGWSELRSLRSEKFHFIEAPLPELYDLRADPGETRNLASERPGAVSELRAELEGVIARFSEGAVEPKEPEILDDETREKLTALGYLGSPRKSAPSEAASTLADPKDKIEVHVRVKAAESAVGAGRIDEALRDIERVLALDSSVVEAHRIRGDGYKAKGALDRAASAYREALALDPGHKVAAFHLALVDLAMGRGDAAEAGLRRVLELDPRDNKSYFLLAKLLLARRDTTSALEVLDQGIATAGDAAPFQTARAEIYLARDDQENAERAAKAALDLDPDAPRANHYLGVLRARRGDVRGAIEAYERELARFPHDPATFLNLAELYRREGRLSDEIRVLERALERAPRLAVLHIRLGRAVLDAGDAARARDLAERGLSLHPDMDSEAMGRRVVAESNKLY